MSTPLNRWGVNVAVVGGFAAAVMVAACATEPNPSVTVTLSKNELAYIGDTAQATAALTDLEGAVTWRSLDESIASIDATGLVTARANGSTTIEATAGGITAGADVVVQQRAADLDFTTQPGPGTGGLPLSAQPVVEVRDAGGTLLAGAGPMVSLALGANPGQGTLFGITSRAAADGVATFAGVAVDKVASGYTLIASVPEGAMTSSEPFDIALGPLSLDSSLVAVERGTVFVRDTTEVTLTVQDAGGNPFSSGGHAVAFDATGGTSVVTFGSVSDNGDGTYTASMVATAFGTPLLVQASIDGDRTTGDGAPLTVIGFTALTAGGNRVVSPDEFTEGTTCGILNTQELYCWGDPAFGRLGHGVFTVEISPRPTLVVGDLSWESVSAGFGVTCGVTIDAAAYCWGAGGEGELGNGHSSGGSIDNRAQPTAVLAGGPVSRVAASPYNGACAIFPDQAAACWGFNSFGRLGDGTTEHRNVPTPIAGDLAFGSVELGIGFGCGVATDGNAYCWGTSTAGVLGIGPTTPPDDCDGTPCALEPMAVTGGRLFVPTSIAVRGNLACAIEQQTAIAYCWGEEQSSPAEVPGGLEFAMLDANEQYICGLTTDGEAYCWGNNEEGQLGIGSQADASTPQPVQGGHTFSTISTGKRHVCGLTPDGAAYCWGGNDSGELGDGTMERRLTPVRVRFFQ